MINYTWTITNVIVNPSITIGDTTYEDVVEEILWRCTGIETGTNTTAYEEQSWPIGFEDPSSFVAFSSLTPEVVLSWLMDDDVKDNQVRWVKGKIEELNITIERLNNTKELEA